MISSQPFATLLLLWIAGVITFTVIMVIIEAAIKWFEKRTDYKIEKTLRSWEEPE